MENETIETRINESNEKQTIAQVEKTPTIKNDVIYLKGLEELLPLLKDKASAIEYGYKTYEFELPVGPYVVGSYNLQDGRYSGEQLQTAWPMKISGYINKTFSDTQIILCLLGDWNDNTMLGQSCTRMQLYGVKGMGIKPRTFDEKRTYFSENEYPHKGEKYLAIKIDDLMWEITTSVNDYEKKHGNNPPK